MPSSWRWSGYDQAKDLQNMYEISHKRGGVFMNVAYQGPLKDYSGYGEANRHAVAALHAAGVNVAAQLVRYTSEPSDFGSIGKLMDELLLNDLPYKIKVMHTTPDEFKRLMEPGKYHIAHFFWETDKVPRSYADGLNLVDEIWTGSQDNADAIKAGGVTTPVFIYPQAIETEREWPEGYMIPDFKGKLFYSIFEWTDRKNPEALLKAFWQEFEGRDDVGLLIKTYFRNFTLQNKKMIRNKIEMLKAQVGTKKFPPVFLYLDLLDRSQMMRVHKTGDVYISAHRGEGWGVPQVEAALAGNPVISTGYGGCHEYFPEGSLYQLPYSMVPLKGMVHAGDLYGQDQKWADVEIDDVRAAMRWAMDNPKALAKQATAGRQVVNTKFNLAAVGKLMADRLEIIEGGL
jgi:glycosyltransferase involved in cell wall biosynthesis